MFRPLEATDSEEVYKATYPWTDLGTLEIYPVMPVEEVMRMVSAMIK